MTEKSVSYTHLPSSVVKELLENTIDAGATMVAVEIQNGGVTYIRITDNGAGIAREDVPTAFLRHATSKVRREEDLEAIGTLGFRGEEMCIRDRSSTVRRVNTRADSTPGRAGRSGLAPGERSSLS